MGWGEEGGKEREREEVKERSTYNYTMGLICITYTCLYLHVNCTTCLRKCMYNIHVHVHVCVKKTRNRPAMPCLDICLS